MGLVTTSLTYYYLKKEDRATACCLRAIAAYTDLFRRLRSLLVGPATVALGRDDFNARAHWLLSAANGLRITATSALPDDAHRGPAAGRQPQRRGRTAALGAGHPARQRDPLLHPAGAAGPALRRLRAGGRASQPRRVGR